MKIGIRNLGEAITTTTTTLTTALNGSDRHSAANLKSDLTYLDIGTSDLKNNFLICEQIKIEKILLRGQDIQGMELISR